MEKAFDEIKENQSARERILEVAEKLFAEYGYDGTSTRIIAEEAGVTKGMIFYYFESKEELYFEVLSLMFNDLIKRLFPIFKARMNYEDKIKKFIDEVFDFFRARPTFCKITQRESVNPRPRYKKFIKEKLKPLYDEGRVFLMKKAGVSDPDNLILSGYGMITSYFNEAEFIGMLLENEPLSSGALKKRREHVKNSILKLVESQV